MHPRLALPLLSAIILVAGCYPQEVAEIYQSPPRNVTVVEVRDESAAQSVQLIGRTRPWQEATIYFEVSGRIQEVFVEEGSQLQPGDPIAQLELGDYELLVAKAKAEWQEAQAELNLLLAGTRVEDLDAARADHARTLARQAFWKLELERAKRMHAAGGAVTSSELERTRREYESSVQEERFAQARLDRAVAGPRKQEKQSAAAQLLARKQAMLQAQRQLDKATIRAPFPGTVERRLVDPGAFINVFPSGGVPAVHLVDLSQVDAELAVPEILVPRFAGLDNIEVASAVNPNLRATARIVAMGQIADKASGTYELRARIPNPARQFTGGMVVIAELPAAKDRRAIRIPVTSVRRAFGQPPYVLLVSSETERADRREIELGTVADNLVEITSGLVGGELLIVRGQHQVVAGDDVRYQRAESLSALRKSEE